MTSSSIETETAVMTYIAEIGRANVLRMGSDLTIVAHPSPRRAQSESRRASSSNTASRIQRACFDDLDAPVERAGLAEVPMPYAKALEHVALTNDHKVMAAALVTCGLQPSDDWLTGRA